MRRLLLDILGVLRDLFGSAPPANWHRYHQPPRYNIRKDP